MTSVTEIEYPVAVHEPHIWMYPEIRRLDEVLDADLLATAWHWQSDAPRWFQESQDGEKETLEQFLDGAVNKLFYGIFEDGEITALIRLNPTALPIYSIDLFARRTVKLDVLLQAGLSIKEYLFDHGAEGFFGWIPKKNRGVIKLYKALGFIHNGTRCFKGNLRGKPVEWLMFRCYKPVDIKTDIS